MRLHHGSAVVTGVRSPFALYDERSRPTAGDAFDHHAADGFIRCYGLPLDRIAPARGERRRPGVKRTLQWGGRFTSALPTRAPRLRLIARRRPRPRTVRRACLPSARRRVTRWGDHHRRSRRRTRARARCGRRGNRRRNVRCVRACRRFRGCSRRDRRPRARTGARVGRVSSCRSQPQRSSRDDARAVYARDRAGRRARSAPRSRPRSSTRARTNSRRRTLLAATTHWQPAQPVLLAFWLDAAAEPFVRRCGPVLRVAMRRHTLLPARLAALAGSTLPLDRERRRDDSASRSRRATPGRDRRRATSRSTSARVRAGRRRGVAHSAELMLWATPAFGYVRLGDASSTGSSLMPQKQNPDPFELVRARRRARSALYRCAGDVTGIGLSYHRDLQKRRRRSSISFRGARSLARRVRARIRRTSRSMREHAAPRRRRLHRRDRYGRRDDRAGSSARARMRRRRDGQRTDGAARAYAEDLAWLAERIDVVSGRTVDAQASIDEARRGSTAPDAVRGDLDSLIARSTRSGRRLTRVHVCGAAGYAAAEAIRLCTSILRRSRRRRKPQSRGRAVGRPLSAASRRTVPLRGAGRVRERCAATSSIVAGTTTSRATTCRDSSTPERG